MPVQRGKFARAKTFCESRSLTAATPATSTGCEHLRFFLSDTHKLSHALCLKRATHRALIKRFMVFAYARGLATI